MRQLTNHADGILCDGRILIAIAIRSGVAGSSRPRAAGIRVIRTAAGAPNCNARATIRAVDQGGVPEPDRAAGRAPLRSTLREFAAHCHAERNHQGLANALIEGPPARAAGNRICRRSAHGRNAQLLLPVSRIARLAFELWDSTALTG